MTTPAHNAARRLLTALALPLALPLVLPLALGATTAHAANTPDADAGSEAPGEIAAGNAITVTGRAADELATARKKLDRIPGGTSVVDADEVERGKAATVQDILALQPGVFVQEVGGNDAIKVSVRGSGINSAPGNMTEGIKWLFDGVGFTGPGGSSYELFEPLGVSYTEVLRGANAFDNGAITLGGAINFVSRTGLTDPGLTAGIQGGSYGYVKGQLAYGGQRGALDWYLSGVYSSADGYQQQTSHHKASLTGNVGYKASEAVQTRFFLRLANEQHYQAGLLTLGQLYANPRQTSAANLSARSDVRKFLSYSFANRTDVALGANDKLTFGVNLSSTPQHINTRSAS
ncbi:MAG TPA: TonB-dependent receptor plug domain-containing protein, partial [Novosphingobium sp.]|nr:TonB-dependent receptor plug domain-containing protein [Novosphingobium sp.]